MQASNNSRISGVALDRCFPFNALDLDTPIAVHSMGSHRTLAFECLRMAWIEE